MGINKIILKLQHLHTSFNCFLIIRQNTSI